MRKEDPEIGGFKLWLKYRRDVDKKYQAGRDKFLRILREAGLLHMPKKKGVKTTDSRHSLPLYPDLRYDLIPERPDQLWVSDITYVHLENGKVLYLCLITDAYTHAILGWKISETMEAKQTLEALEMAIEGEKAKGRDLAGLIHHSDRGSQYASVAYTARLKEEGIQISMTQCGNPKDNAIAERVNGTLKNELCGKCKFHGLQEAEEIFRRKIYFYNNERPHLSNGPDALTPKEADGYTGRMERYWISYREIAIDRLAMEGQDEALTAPAGG